MRELLKMTDEAHPDYDALKRAHGVLENIAEHVVRCVCLCVCLSVRLAALSLALLRCHSTALCVHVTERTKVRGVLDKAHGTHRQEPVRLAVQIPVGAAHAPLCDGGRLVAHRQRTACVASRVSLQRHPRLCQIQRFVHVCCPSASYPLTHSLTRSQAKININSVVCSC